MSKFGFRSKKKNKDESGSYTLIYTAIQMNAYSTSSNCDHFSFFCFVVASVLRYYNKLQTEFLFLHFCQSSLSRQAMFKRRVRCYVTCHEYKINVCKNWNTYQYMIRIHFFLPLKKKKIGSLLKCLAKTLNHHEAYSQIVCFTSDRIYNL